MRDFEEKAREIFRELCPYRVRGIIDPATGRADEQSSLRMRNADFATAQKLIVNELQSLTATKRMLNAQIKDANKNRNRKQLFRSREALVRENFKETIIRKLADSIAWQLIDGRSDLAQWMHAYEDAPAIDKSNLPSVLEEVERITRDDSLSFGLLSDLTSFIRVGDIIKRDTSGILKIIEVKEGEGNQKAMAILQDELALKQAKLDPEKLRSSHGKHLGDQVMRIQKQLAKGAQVKEILNTGKGTDPRTGDAVIIKAPSHSPTSYASELAGLILQLNKKSWSYTVLDGGLLVGCYKGIMKGAGRSALELIAQQTFRQSFLTINYRQGLEDPLSEPVFLKPFPEDDIFDIVFDRIRVYLILSLEWIIEAFSKLGANAKWLSKRETAELRQGNRHESPFIFRDKAISIEKDDWSLILGGGSLRRIVFDNLLPTSVVSMLVDSLDSCPS